MAVTWLAARLSPRAQDDGNAAGHGSLEADGALGLAHGLENLGPRISQERLVRGDNVLARRECFQDEFFCGCGAADELDNDVDAGVAEDIGGVRGEEFAGNRGIAVLVEVADEDASQRERSARSRPETLAPIQQQVGDPAPDRSTPRDGNPRRFAHEIGLPRCVPVILHAATFDTFLGGRR